MKDIYGEKKNFEYIISTLKTSHVAENGRTAIPTNKSATARLTIKKLVTFRNLCEQKTAAITKQLPTITSTLMNARKASESKLVGSVQFTELMSVQLFPNVPFNKLAIFRAHKRSLSALTFKDFPLHLFIPACSLDPCA